MKRPEDVAVKDHGHENRPSGHGVVYFCTPIVRRCGSLPSAWYLNRKFVSGWLRLRSASSENPVGYFMGKLSDIIALSSSRGVLSRCCTTHLGASLTYCWCLTRESENLAPAALARSCFPCRLLLPLRRSRFQVLHLCVPATARGTLAAAVSNGRREPLF